MEPKAATVDLEIRLACGLCGDSHEQKIPMPDGWNSRYQSVSDENAFCPKHSIVAKFADSQCPGCVGGWGDCDLHRSYAYSKLTLAPADFAALESGVCPKRTGGTFMFNSSGLTEHIDLRDAPVVDAGRALAQAIREYAIKYHKETKQHGT